MVIDTSAVAAILFGEPGWDRLAGLLEADPVRMISAASVLEAAIVVEARLGAVGGRELDLMFHVAGVQVVPVTAEQVEIARDAYRTYGKGRHQARLNLGDCFPYALSKTSGEKLLFVGDDFGKTDVEAVKALQTRSRFNSSS